MSRFRKDIMWSSISDEWETPQDVFDHFNSIFNFTLDVCASPDNAKCERYFTKEDDGLRHSWVGEVFFMNPPFTENKKWIRKAYLSCLKPNTIGVCLIPARTGTTWFHDYCVYGEIWFIRGRLRFRRKIEVNGEIRVSNSPAPFNSMVVIFPKNWKETLDNRRILNEI